LVMKRAAKEKLLVGTGSSV